LSLFDRIKRLERKARGDLDWLDLQDGSRYLFDPMAVRKELFLEYIDSMASIPGEDMSEGAEPDAELDLTLRDVLEPSPLRQALANATPRSIRRFEERYGPAERDCAVFEGDGTVTVVRIAVDGSRSLETLVGDEAEEYLEKARTQPARFA
jgi:hypothetical protein